MKKVKQVSPDCGFGACPAVFEIASECGIGACPTVFGTDSEEQLIIVGAVPSPEELRAISHRAGPGETAVKIPKSLLDGMKR